MDRASNRLDGCRLNGQPWIASNVPMSVAGRWEGQSCSPTDVYVLGAWRVHGRRGAAPRDGGVDGVSIGSADGGDGSRRGGDVVGCFA
jgi:hypothetical protein